MDCLKNDFIKRGYEQTFIQNQFDRISTRERNSLLQPKKNTNTYNRVPLVITYNKTLPNLKEILLKHWGLLQINQTIRTAFEEKSIIAYRRNKNLCDLIGSNKIINSKKAIKIKEAESNGKSTPCFTRRDNLCCKQIIKTETFSSFRTGQTFRIFHQLNCKSYGIIYLLQCQICLIQYIGKSETPFNIRLNNHRKDAKDTKSKNNILACKHFQEPNHEFQKHAKFTLIEKISKNCATSTQLRLL